MCFDFDGVSNRLGIDEGNNAQWHEFSIGDEKAKTKNGTGLWQPGKGSLFRALTPNVRRRLIITKRNEPRVPQMVLACPFHELELPHQYRF